MFIDKTYFFGPLEIAQLELVVVGAGQPTVLNLQQFIDLYEPEVLQKLFGYPMYKQFLLGVQEPAVAQKWTDLLYGKEYTALNGKAAKWRGLVSYTDGITIGSYFPADREYIVGGGGAYDPAVGSTEINDPFLVGKKYRFIERGTGPLSTGGEWAVTGTGLQILAHAFEVDGFYTVEFIPGTVLLPTPAVIVPSAKQSLIANYIYYKWMQQKASVITGSGLKVLNAQNAQATREENKKVSAWNYMKQWVSECSSFLRAFPTDYPDYDWQHCGWDAVDNIYSFKNSLGV